MDSSNVRCPVSPVATKQLEAKFTMAGRRVATGLVCLLLLNIPGCGSGGKSDSGDVDGKNSAAADTTPAVVNPRDTAKEDPGAKITIYSDPPGCAVFVDYVPVRNENEGLALTPCEFTVSRGLHSISVERPGGKRAVQSLDTRNAQELEFDVTSSPNDTDDPSILNAPLFEAAVGRAIPLESLNSNDQELDPFLSPDGCTIYFASERGGVRGIYTSTRPTPYHDFSEPKIIQASSGADLPVSPSVSNDGLTLIYAVAEKSRLWQLVRPSIDVPFDGKEITRSDEKGERSWRSAQISGDSLRLYWTEEGDDKTVTRAATRSASNKLFGKSLSYELAGIHPHLSSDGLRQFSFDGTTLKRSRRGSIRQTFGAPETVVEIAPENYSESVQYRQYSVTDDEQWLFYCDKPGRSADLYVVRLSDGPGWGRSYLGKPAPNKMVVATTEPEEKPKPEPMPTETVDARNTPLAYTSHWAELLALLEANRGDDAVALVKEAMKQKKMSQDKELLAWDLQLAEALAELEKELQAALRALKPGAMIRVAGSRFEFESYDGETLHLKLKDKEFQKKLTSMTPGERISLIEGTEKASGEQALRFAIYLFFQGKIQQTLAENWFKRAGPEAEVFHERLAARVLHQGKSELARGNMAAGIDFLDSVAFVSGPGTAAAREAVVQRSKLYDLVDWNPVGNRKWGRGEQGAFIADPARSNGSYLKSDQKYTDFELSCEWKVEGSTATGGVYLRYSGQGKPLDNGAKIHLANDAGLKRMDRFATGALFAKAAASQNVSLAEGKWNTLKMQVRGTDVKVWINEKDVLTATLEKGVPLDGYVMLDGEAGGIAYRKVLIFELPSGSAAVKSE